MLTVEIFQHGWNTPANHSDAIFWANWLNVPGRYTLPTEGRPGASWQLESNQKVMPAVAQIAFNLQTLRDRLPTTYIQLQQVMHTLRVQDALPLEATEQQKHAAEAMIMAGELEVLYAFGSQLVQLQVQAGL